MSTYDYSSIYSKAVAAITKYGGSFSIKRLNGTKEYDPVEQSYVYYDSDGNVISEAVEDTIQGVGVLTQYTTDEVDGEAIKRSDKKLLAVEIPSPKSEDIFVIGGVKYQYISHDEIQPNMEDTLLYKIQVRI